MRKVKFIKSLNIEEVMSRDPNNIRYHEVRLDDWSMTLDRQLVNAKTDKKIVPIHHISEGRRYECEDSPDGYRAEITDTYIAYSEEVEKLLEMPFKLINDENKELQLKVDRLNSELLEVRSRENRLRESLWLRVKFLFNGSRK